MHSIPDIYLAFSSVEFIMRDVSNCWLIRHSHANEAFMFLIVVYCCIFRGLHYGSYIQLRQLLWCFRTFICILTMATTLYGSCFILGSNKFFGGYCYYKFCYSYSRYRTIYRRLVMSRFHN
jgi:ubiquinol-cytochrome c reductase cytochrome b subunit